MCPNHRSGGRNGVTIAQSAAAANRQKESPGRHRPGRGEVCHVTEIPVPRSVKGQVTAQRQTSLWRKCETTPFFRQQIANVKKMAPNNQAGARLTVMPIRREAERRAPVASARFVAGLWPRQDVFKVPGPRCPRNISKKEPRPRKSRLRIAPAKPNLARRYCKPDGTDSLLPVRGMLPAAVRRRIDILKPPGTTCPAPSDEKQKARHCNHWVAN